MGYKLLEFFRKILGIKSPAEKLNLELQSVYDPSNETDRVAVALLVNLKAQLELLGFEIGEVPALPKFINEKCRGYLYGISLGILISENIELSKDAIIDTLIAAFALTYGDEAGRALSFDTAQDINSGNRNVIAASDWAIEEVKAVYSNGGTTSALGFYHAVNGMI